MYQHSLTTLRLLRRWFRPAGSSKNTMLPDRGHTLDASGWKVAVLDDVQPASFQGYSWGRYGLRGKARCRVAPHQAPAPDCRCGFHALKSRAEAERLLPHRAGAVLLEVELYGELVAHSKGWRGAEQEVMAVHLPAECEVRRCQSPTWGVQQRRHGWRTVCQEHHTPRCVSVSTLRAQWLIDVSADAPAR